MMFGRYKAWTCLDPARLDREVVVTPAITLPAVFQDAHTASFRTVGGRQFFKPDDAMGDAVGRLVSRFGGKVVQQQHGGTVTSEIVLDREKLAPVSQRALGEKADLGEPVEHHPRGPHALNSIENLLCRFRQARGRMNRANSVAVLRPKGFQAE